MWLRCCMPLARSPPPSSPSSFDPTSWPYKKSSLYLHHLKGIRIEYWLATRNVFSLSMSMGPAGPPQVYYISFPYIRFLIVWNLPATNCHSTNTSWQLLHSLECLLTHSLKGTPVRILVVASHSLRYWNVIAPSKPHSSSPSILHINCVYRKKILLHVSPSFFHFSQSSFWLWFINIYTKLYLHVQMHHWNTLICFHGRHLSSFLFFLGKTFILFSSTNEVGSVSSLPSPPTNLHFDVCFLIISSALIWVHQWWHAIKSLALGLCLHFGSFLFFDHSKNWVKTPPPIYTHAFIQWWHSTFFSLHRANVSMLHSGTYNDLELVFMSTKGILTSTLAMVVSPYILQVPNAL